jgi:hypothetical protein
MKYKCKLCKDTGEVNDGWSREIDDNGEQIPYTKDCVCGGGKMNYFSDKEISCKCSCGLKSIAPIALETLNKI